MSRLTKSTKARDKRHGAVASVGIAVFAALFSAVGSPTADAATVLTFSPLPHRMETALQGSLCESPNTCTEVDYDFSLPVSVSRLTTAIKTATTTLPGSESGVIVFGLSGGAGAAAKWMRAHAADADAPSAEILSFVLIGNPGRKYGGSSRRFATDPVTQYKVIDIARQYDPIADSPDDPFNFLAHMNVMAGLLSPLHTNYSAVDIDDPRNIRWVEGNTTYILVPTDDLPLTYGLRALGLGALADSLDGRLREIIERGYNRPPEVDAALELLRQNPPPVPAPAPVRAVASRVASVSAMADGGPSARRDDSGPGDTVGPDALSDSDAEFADLQDAPDPEAGTVDDDDTAATVDDLDDADTIESGDVESGDVESDSSTSAPSEGDADGSATSDAGGGGDGGGSDGGGGDGGGGE